MKWNKNPKLLVYFNYCYFEYPVFTNKKTENVKLKKSIRGIASPTRFQTSDEYFQPSNGLKWATYKKLAERQSFIFFL